MWKSRQRKSRRQALKVMDDLLEDWRIWLRARNRSLGTIDSYLGVGGKFAAYLMASDGPGAIDEPRCEHVEGAARACLGDLRSRVRFERLAV